MTKIKNYVVQELYVIGGRHYWWDITQTNDYDMAKRLKDLYRSKDKLQIFRVIEVRY